MNVINVHGEKVKIKDQILSLINPGNSNLKSQFRQTISGRDTKG